MMIKKIILNKKNQEDANLFLSLILSLFCFLSASNLQAKKEQGELIEALLAVVDGDAIFYSTINNKISGNSFQQKFVTFPATTKSSDFDRALQEEVNLRLVFQECERLNLHISEEDVSKQIDRIVEHNKITMEELKQSLLRDNKTLSSLRKDIEQQMKISLFNRRVIYPHIKQSDRAVEAYYRNKTGKSPSSVVVRLKRVVVNDVRHQSEIIEKERKEIIEKAYLKLKNGTSIDEVIRLYSAKEYSDPKEYVEYQISDLQKDLKEKLENLDENQFTKPFFVGSSMNIFYVVSKKTSISEEFARVKQQMKFELRQVQAEEQVKIWLQKQRAIKKISIISNG